MNNRKFLVPEYIHEKITEFPEYSYGAHRVTLVMKDGAKIRNVFIAWARQIVKIGQTAEVNFDPDDIVDVENEP